MEAPLSPTVASQMALYDNELDAFLAFEAAGDGTFIDPFTHFEDLYLQDNMMQQMPVSDISPSAVSSSDQTSSDSGHLVPAASAFDQLDLQASIDPALMEGVPYPQVATLRSHQRAQGWNLQGLSQVQLGLEAAQRCHHITMNQTIKGGPLSHRVRVCKRCCGEDTHIELGTYLDQESAMLVNDAHELLHHRHAKLLILTPQDITFLYMFNARRYNRGKAEVKAVLDIVKERELEREQRKNMQVIATNTLKRRRTAARDGQALRTLTAMPATPTELVDIDKDSLIHKLSPVLDRMVAHASLTFKKQPTIFHERFRYIFSKAMAPSPMDAPADAFEHMLASVTTTLLSSYGDTMDAEIRYLMEAIDSTYLFTEDTDLYCQVSEIMDDAVESPILPELHMINQVISKYLDEVKIGMWKHLQESKYPLSNDPHSLEEEAMQCETNELLAVSDRKRHILSRLRAFLLDLLARYDEFHPALSTTRCLLRVCTIYLSWYTVGVASCRLRSNDLTSNLEHADVALSAIDQLVDCGDDMSQLEELHLLVHKLAVYNCIYSRRRERAILVRAPSTTVQYVFNRLLSLSTELGLLPNKGNKPQPSTTEVAIMSEQLAGPQANEWRCMVYGYIFEYSFIHSQHVQWPDGMTFQDLIKPFRETLRQVQEDAMRKGIVFVMPYAWRALYIAMHACGQACIKYSDCLRCAYDLSQMCFNILTEGGKRFGFARFYATRAEGILKDMHQFQNKDARNGGSGDC